MEHSGNRGKDREYWREVEDWDIVIMSETWLKKGVKTEGRMPRDYKWEVQLASRKNKKGRIIGGMLMGIRRGLKVMEEEGGREMEGMMMRLVRIGQEKWKIIGVYINGNMKEI